MRHAALSVAMVAVVALLAPLAGCPEQGPPTCNVDDDCVVPFEECRLGHCAPVPFVADEGEGESAEGEGEEGEGEEGEGEGEGEGEVTSSFEHWGLNEPNSDAEDCLVITLGVVFKNVTGDWNDVPCTNVRPFICEIPTQLATAPCAQVVGTEVRLFCDDTQADTGPNAAAVCATAGGALARVDDAAENDELVAEALTHFTATQAYVGGDDVAVEGAWHWSDGTTALPVDPFSEWQVGQPNGGAIERCAALQHTATIAPAPETPAGVWLDDACAATRGFVCDVPSGTVGACAIESVGGKRRAFCDGAVTYAQARTSCTNAGGALAVIRDAVENAALVARASVLAPTTPSVWIGLDDLAVEGTWVASDGVVVDGFE